MFDRTGRGIGSEGTCGSPECAQEDLGTLDDRAIFRILAEPLTSQTTRRRGFEVLLSRYGRLLRGLARRFAQRIPGDSPCRAEEIAQEVALRFWRTVEARETIHNFGAWMWTVAYHVFLDQAREQGRHLEVPILDRQDAGGDLRSPRGGVSIEELDSSLFSSASDPGEPIYLAELEGILTECLKRYMSTSKDARMKLRALANLRIDRLTQIETADRLGVSEITIRRWEKEIDRRIRDILMEMGVPIRAGRGKRARARGQSDAPCVSD